MTRRQRLLRNSILTVLAAFPLVLSTLSEPSTPLQGSMVNAPPVIPREDLRKRARAYKPTLMQERRMYTQYGDKCRDRTSADPAFVCPDYHDRQAVRAFLMDEETVKASMHAAATATGTTVILRLENLSGTDQALMRRYQNAQACPVSLKGYTPGFYDLCKSLLSTTTSRAARKGVPKNVEKRFGYARKAREQRKAARMERMGEGR